MFKIEARVTYVNLRYKYTGKDLICELVKTEAHKRGWVAPFSLTFSSSHNRLLALHLLRTYFFPSLLSSSHIFTRSIECSIKFCDSKFGFNFQADHCLHLEPNTLSLIRSFHLIGLQLEIVPDVVAVSPSPNLLLRQSVLPVPSSNFYFYCISLYSTLNFFRFCNKKYW